MAPSCPESLHTYLVRVPENRKYNALHPLHAILTLCVCAVMCGARSQYAIAQWGREHGSEIARQLGFRRDRTPCHASIHNTLKRLDIEAFENVLADWASQFVDADKLKAASIDGKKLRGIHGEQVPGVFLIAAFAHEMGIPLAQHGATDRDGELTGARSLLDRMKLKK
jgi:hypothetical protein